mgnify:FL=1
MKLGIIAKKIDAVLEGDAEIEINGLESIDNAMSGDITFLTNSKYYEFINITNASAIIVKNDFSKKSKCALLKVDDPDKAFGEVASLFYVKPPKRDGIHSSAFISENVTIGKK